MNILDKYNTTSNRSKALADRILFRVIDDFRDRSGFDDWWGNIDTDIQNEILNSLHKTIEKELLEK
jgi:hypothetical protein